MPTRRRSARNAPLPREAAIYCRISTDRPKKQLGVKRQEDDCRRAAKKAGWVVGVTRLYVDNDISAYSGRPRPRYRQLLEDIKAGAVDGLITWHPDRLHRSPTELEEFIKIIEDADIPVITDQAGDYDLSTSDGRFGARIAGTVARHESEHKSERIRRKHEELAVAGAVSGGGDRPFGYEDDRLKVRRSEAKLIADGARRILAGESLRSIVGVWNASGVTTSGGRPWYTSGVRRVLNSARIAGLREHQGALYKAVWPAIISRADWDRLRKLFTNPARRTNRSPRKYVLAGLLRCSCGSRLVARPRAAECTTLVAIRSSLRSARSDLADLRARIRDQRKVIATTYSNSRKNLPARRSLPALTRDLAKLRADAANRETSITQLTRSVSPHIPISQKASIKSGAATRTCMCKAPLVSRPTYVCSKDSDPNACGKVRRLAEPVEQLIAELVIHRVDGPDLRKALWAQARRGGTKVTRPASDLTKLEAQQAQLAEDWGLGRIGRREWLAARDVIQKQIEAYHAATPTAPAAAALAPFVRGGDALAKRWPMMTFDARRAVLQAVLDRVVVSPARPGLNRFDPSRIEPIWRV